MKYSTFSDASENTYNRENQVSFSGLDLFFYYQKQSNLSCDRVSLKAEMRPKLTHTPMKQKIIQVKYDQPAANS